MLRTMNWSTMTDHERQWLLSRGTAGVASTELRDQIAALVEDVRLRGDDALIEALHRHDGFTLLASQLRVTPDEMATARASLEPGLRDAIGVMLANITAFNNALHERRTSWRTELGPGHVVGEEVRPVASAAAFCPSGKASYPSVLAQVATGAVVAGVPQLIAIVPPKPGGAGELDAAVLTVALELGIEDVFRVNGPAGIAAAAFGTETIPAVRRIVGPGSPPVALAQLEVRRHGVDSVVLGPSESMVIADGSADVELLAADLMIEAEHGTDGTVLLVTPHPDLIPAVSAAIEVQIVGLPAERAEAIRASVGTNGGGIVVESMAEAITVANWFAPEHLQLAVADPEPMIGQLNDVGEVLLGQTTPFSAGNFCLGAPAALPTGGFAKQAGGITVETFLKATSIGALSPAALAAIAPSVISLATNEGFPAHANAIRRRDPAFETTTFPGENP